MQRLSLATLGLLLSAGSSLALDLNLNDPDSIKSAAKSIVSNIVSLYGDPSTPGFTPGLFPSPYYFFEDGLAFDSLVNYWALTGDNTYVNLTRDALVWQLSPDNDYMPPNQTKALGNDDQSTWGLAAMTAAEKQFPAPSGNLSWAQIAQNVFDSQVPRWDSGSCKGGLRWQIFAFNSGYSYKNSIANGNLAQLGARLARFAGSNQTYSEWASKSLDWSQSVGLITEQGNVFDGTDSNKNCTDVNKIQWTAYSGTWISAAAYSSNMTGSSSTWTDLLESVGSLAQQIFVNDSDILFESACAPAGNCNVDQLAFRAVFARALANANNFADAGNGSLSSNFTRILQASAKGAAAQCSGGENGTVCGSDWSKSTWDGTSGLGQYLSALEVILANLPQSQAATASSTPNATNAGNAPSTSSSTTVDSNNTNAASTMMASVFLSFVGIGLAALL